MPGDRLLAYWRLHHDHSCPLEAGRRHLAPIVCGPLVRICRLLANGGEESIRAVPAPGTPRPPFRHSNCSVHHQAYRPNARNRLAVIELPPEHPGVVPGRVRENAQSAMSGFAVRTSASRLVVPAVRRTGHPFAALGSREPSQKIELVFTASPETIRRSLWSIETSSLSRHLARPGSLRIDDPFLF